MYIVKLYLIFFWKFIIRTFPLGEFILLLCILLDFASKYPNKDIPNALQYYTNIFLLVSLIIFAGLTIVFVGANLLLSFADKTKIK